jgi:hypothetical protein
MAREIIIIIIIIIIEDFKYATDVYFYRLRKTTKEFRIDGLQSRD